MPADPLSTWQSLRAAIDAAVSGDLEQVRPITVPEPGDPSGDESAEGVLDVDGAQVAAAARAFNSMVESVQARIDVLERRRAEFYRALQRLGDALAATHDRGAMIDAVLETTALVLQPEAAVFFVPTGSRLRARAVLGTADPALDLAVGEGLAGEAGRTGRALLWPGDVSPSPAEPTTDAATALAIPVQAGNRRFGVLALYGRHGVQPYASADVEALRGLLAQAATAIDNTYLYEEAARLAITDGLTGLWNRRQFDLWAAGELQRARRFKESFGLVMIDIDRFKEVNDHYGHQAGDGVLVELARRLTDTTRDVDVVARFGGEEFVLLLPNTSLEGACVLAAKLRQRVAAEPFRVDELELSTTISVGVACYPLHGDTVQALLATADAALYRAKSGGRDRVEVADGGRPGLRGSTPRAQGSGGGRGPSAPLTEGGAA